MSAVSWQAGAIGTLLVAIGLGGLFGLALDAWREARQRGRDQRRQ